MMDGSISKFCRCGLRVVKKWGISVCEVHGTDTKRKPPRKKIGKYSGPMGEKHKRLLRGRD